MRSKGHRTARWIMAIAMMSFAWAGSAYAKAEYVGAAECMDCHEDQANTLAETQHGKAAFSDLSEHGCETCHGPGGDHVKQPNKAEFQPSIEKLSAKELVNICTSCHTGGKQSHWEGSRHEMEGVGCNDCHSIHSPGSAMAQLKFADETETCFQCHKQIRSETRKTSHHPVREGKIGCSDCHNPHGTVTDKLIAAVSVNELCYECHTEKRGPFLWEHAPVRENCLNCHTPHGSNHAKLQKTSVPFLCQQCHSNTRHPGTLYDATTLPAAARVSNRIDNRACVNCHASIHGSNHPSGPYLGR